MRVDSGDEASQKFRKGGMTESRDVVDREREVKRYIERLVEIERGKERDVEKRKKRNRRGGSSSFKYIAAGTRKIGSASRRESPRRGSFPIRIHYYSFALPK